MARPSSGPARTLVGFGLGVAVLFGMVALTGTWRPALGLDLQGGQRITVQTADEVSGASLEEAADIIDRRVDDSGVAGAEVTTRGEDRIVVEIPGESDPSLVEVVRRQAQLGIRLVACSSQVTGPCTGAADAGTDAGPDASPSAPAAPGNPVGEAGDVQAALAWIDAPGQESVQAFNDATCPPEGDPQGAPDEPLVACDPQGVKYLLSVPVVEGTELEDAEAGQGAGSSDWLVQLELDGDGARRFGEVSQALAPGRRPFAIVLDGQVVSAPRMESVINDGRASITGDFDEETATELATSLEYGALPVAFEEEPGNETVGASLAGNQLTAGIWAAVAGLLVLMLGCLLRYRALSGVLLASLAVTGLVTYGVVLLFGEGAGFVVSVPALAGLVVATAVAADSFVVLLERIRGELRDGKSLTVAVESGWQRARDATVAADAVLLLAAVVLYVLAVDEVRGFAFALGLVTLVDLVVLFWFTGPLVTWLGRRPFFGRGHRLSGLAAGQLGLDRPHDDALAGAAR